LFLERQHVTSAKADAGIGAHDFVKAERRLEGSLRDSAVTLDRAADLSSRAELRWGCGRLGNIFDGCLGRVGDPPVEPGQEDLQVRRIRIEPRFVALPEGEFVPRLVNGLGSLDPPDKRNIIADVRRGRGESRATRSPLRTATPHPLVRGTA
jgi:hypothetical protein